ncbi:MAG: hypothetical protein Q4D27_03175, partial [Coriobacteriia bacterium]|nr:hypothetical protein [Coriobacteriia bacterium]
MAGFNGVRPHNGESCQIPPIYGRIRRRVGTQRRIVPQAHSAWQDSMMCGDTALNRAANPFHLAEFGAVRPHNGESC